MDRKFQKVALWLSAYPLLAFLFLTILFFVGYFLFLFRCTSWGCLVNRIGVFCEALAALVTLMTLLGPSRLKSWETKIRHFADQLNSFLKEIDSVFVPSFVQQGMMVRVLLIIGVVIWYGLGLFVILEMLYRGEKVWAIVFLVGFFLPILFALISVFVKGVIKKEKTARIFLYEFMKFSSVFAFPFSEALAKILEKVVGFIRKQLPLKKLVTRFTVPVFLFAIFLEYLATYI